MRALRISREICNTKFELCLLCTVLLCTVSALYYVCSALWQRRTMAARTTQFPTPVPVEIIKSRPVVDAQSAPTTSAGKDTGVLSPLEQMLRQDPLAGAEQAPRPPLPVGE